MKKKYILGIDIGGSTIKAGLVSLSYRISQKKQINVRGKDATAFTQCLAELIKKYDLSLCQGIGVGCPGPADYKKGVVINPPNIPWQNFNLKHFFKKITSLPVAISNDANCFTLAEAILGKGKKHQVVIGLTLGTGIGGGVVIDKKIFSGKNNAGEFGHLIIEGQDLETTLHQHPLVKKWGFQNLAAKAKQNNKQALRFWQFYGEKLGIALVNIIHSYDPDIIILGGGVSHSFSLFKTSMYSAIKPKLLLNLPLVVKSRMLNTSNIIGAALLTK